MKKICFLLFLGFISINAKSNFVYGKISVNPGAFDDVILFGTTTRDINAVQSFNYADHSVLDVKDIHPRAIVDFRIRFNQVNDAVWYSVNNGYVSYFLLNGYGERVFYDKKGRWEFSLLLYGEDKLNREVRASVKSVYFDMAITQVEEVQTLAGLVYIVNLEDKSTIKILKVTREGEIHVLLDLVKE